MGSVNVLPIDIPEHSFKVEQGVQFDPWKLDYNNPEKEKITQVVVKMLKKVIDFSNANIIKNADGLLAKKTVQQDVEWVRKDKKRLPDNRYKMSY